jgi:hypothetical protein
MCLHVAAIAGHCFCLHGHALTLLWTRLQSRVGQPIIAFVMTRATRPPPGDMLLFERRSRDSRVLQVCINRQDQVQVSPCPIGINHLHQCA